ncbi:MAG: hypothetical protein COB67_02855 [SAR324 cluster bacterium]|uniref:histidine kinase n=1 Tax=SAR324 cluster bacterium TaxID=2024889 RepID=A0A2A4T933_9DELT|nr:MAG: hypothetical protein COB67_02855 [SAR324 cluster bacterium]
MKELVKDSELRFKSIMDSANDAIISGDQEGRILSWNKGAEGLFGYRKEEVLGKLLTLFIPERYREAHNQGIRRMSEGHKAQAIGLTLEVHGLHRDGTEFPIELSLSTWQSEEGRFYGGIIRDISLRKKAEAAKREADLRFRAIIASANDAIITADSEGQITTWNTGAESVFKYREEEVLGKNLRMIIPERYHEAHNQGIERMNAGGAPRAIGTTVELHGVRKNGSEFPIELSLAGWKTENDAQYSGIIRDITERKGLESKVAERSQAIKELMDNSGQGFLTFEQDYKIGSEYSKACHSFLGSEIAQKDVLTTLFEGTQSKDPSAIRELLDLIFADISNLSLVEELLPKELKINQRILELEYRPIQTTGDNSRVKIMLILTDVTLQKQLAQQIKLDEERKEIIVKVATDKDGFIHFLHELEQQFDGVLSMLQVEPTQVDLDGLFRSFHTIKGGAASYALKDLSQKAHAIENQLTEFKNNQELLNVEQCSSLAQQTQQLREILQKVLIDLNEILPAEERNSRESVFKVSQPKLEKLESRLAQLLGDRYSLEVKKEIARLRKQPIAPLFKKYAIAAEELAVKLGKEIQVKFEGMEVDVSFEHLDPLFSVLIHLIRNSVDHGLETPDLRVMLGKQRVGQLTLKASLEENSLKLLVTDDGAGIDPARLLQIALENKILLPEEASQLDAAAILKLIFAPGFSTKESVSMVSGRGVGMDAVKVVVEELGGELKVDSVLDQGTCFEISIPQN